MKPGARGQTGQRSVLFYRILAGVVSLIVLVALVLTVVRVLLTPIFVNIEYRTPNFPDDPYGFSQADRLYWSQIALDYLLNQAGISFLGDLRFADGSPVYNERELGHMVDVKIVVTGALRVWYASLLALLLLGLWAWRARWWLTFRQALSRGGWLTVIFVGVIIPIVLVGFGVFFVAFHEVFFDPGTWVFRYSDTLIRLFPERFWRDAFLAIAALSLVGGLAVALGLRQKSAAH